MKLSQAILELNKLRKQHGDVDILVCDDNNGLEKEFVPEFEPEDIVTTGDGQRHKKGGFVIV